MKRSKVKEKREPTTLVAVSEGNRVGKGKKVKKGGGRENHFLIWQGRSYCE